MGYQTEQDLSVSDHDHSTARPGASVKKVELTQIQITADRSKARTLRSAGSPIQHSQTQWADLKRTESNKQNLPFSLKAPVETWGLNFLFYLPFHFLP